jgi:hypothetical protein
MCDAWSYISQTVMEIISLFGRDIVFSYRQTIAPVPIFFLKTVSVLVSKNFYNLQYFGLLVS